MTDTYTETILPDEEELAVLFHQASRLLARVYHRQARPGHAQARVYGLIKKHGPVSQAKLLKLLDVRSASLSEVLRKLEREELIVRTRNPEDRRGFVLTVNEAATPSFATPPAHQETGEKTPFASLDPEERGQLAEILGKIIRSAKEIGGSCGPPSCKPGKRRRGKGGKGRKARGFQAH